MSQTAPATQIAPKAQEVKRFEEGTVDSVLQRITEYQTTGDIRLPENYSPENAVRSAWLVLNETKDTNKKPVLETCSKVSISNALFDMVIQGLSVIKKQCYFIAYGDKLTCMKSYIGTIAVAKRFANVKDVSANVIYQGDEFEYEIDTVKGRKRILTHKQSIDNIDLTKIKGAYATIEFNDGTFECEVMTSVQIQKAWNQGPTNGSSPAHKNFPDEMSKKSVIQRALKLKIGSSDDSALFDDEDHYEDAVSSTVSSEIKQNANKQTVGFNKPKEISQPLQPLPKKEEPLKQAASTPESQPELSHADQPGF